MNDRLDEIRNEERKYHEHCYDHYKLFEAGSWLHKPVKTVMDTFARLDHYESVSVLDLGSGVGRNSIPIAETLKSRDGKVVCVDLIEAALTKLTDYSEQYGVREYIHAQQSDITDFIIAPDEFDYIIAVSALEHVRSESDFRQVLERMVRGTKEQGMNCIIMGTNIQEVDMESWDELQPLMELNMPTEQAKGLISQAYSGWEAIFSSVKPLTFTIERNGRKIRLKCDCLTFAWQRAAIPAVK